jgi:nicotinamidase-related amidase
MVNSLAALDAKSALLLVIDLQEKLLPSMQHQDAVVATASKLMQAAKVLQLPVLVTEQYPKGLGNSCAQVKALMEDEKAYEKVLFSACIPPVRDTIQQSGRKQIIVCGIEAHVCVQQSVLDLLRMGLDVWVCADGVDSRRGFDRDVALSRMQHAGAMVTTSESVIFEMVREAGGEVFKQILKIVK